MSIILSAIAKIEAAGLNRFRCCLTGAPYATLDSSEINLALQVELENDPNISEERLIDAWELKALTFNTQVLPSLRGIKERALVPMLNSGAAGQVKLVTYLLTRLFFPRLGMDHVHTEEQRERMLFAIHMHDAASEWEPMKTGEFVQKLLVIDSYLAMPYWHTLWAFESSFSKLGIDKAPKKVQSTFAEPLTITEDMTRLDAVIGYLYELMIFVTERDGVIGKSGSRFAQAVMSMTAEHLPKIVIPHFQKTLSEADRARLENRKRLDSRTELRIAHSAIHGKKTPLNYHESGAWQMAQEMRKNLKAKAKADADKKTKPATESKKRESKTKIDPRFAAAFNKLVLTPFTK